MNHPLAGAFFALALVVPASAGTTGGHPPAGLTASPAHVVLDGSGTATVRVSNTGSSTVVVDAHRAGFALDLRGRPRVLPRASLHLGSSWLTVRPRSFSLRPGAATELTLTAKIPRLAEPGDHAALVLLTARPRPHGGLVVRMRLGVVVDVRAPGQIVHRLLPLRLTVRRARRARSLELLVANVGNVSEELATGSTSLTLRHQGKVIATLRGEPRRILPRTRGVMLFRYRGRRRGAVTADIVLTTDAGPARRRRYRLRL